MIILTGASASGKTEVGKYLNDKYGIKKVVTYTTRPMREGEVNKVDYNFISVNDFLSLKDKGFFFETMEYNGNFYGTSKESLLSDAYVILDFRGLEKYIASDIKFTSFYLDCEESVRFSRMILRGDLESDAKKRIEVDRIAFSSHFKALVNFVIDSTHLTVEEVGNTIYNKSH